MEPAYVPYQRLAQDVLAQWRAVERRVEALDPLGPEADVLKLESYRLCSRYQELIARVEARHSPEATAFPEPERAGDRFDFAFGRLSV